MSLTQTGSVIALVSETFKPPCHIRDLPVSKTRAMTLPACFLSDVFAGVCENELPSQF